MIVKDVKNEDLLQLTCHLMLLSWICVQMSDTLPFSESEYTVTTQHVVQVVVWRNYKSTLCCPRTSGRMSVKDINAEEKQNLELFKFAVRSVS